ncbi:MAG TPA: protein-L-isoaspartate O-methyltransferase [Hansschlegelia sp.]
MTDFERLRHGMVDGQIRVADVTDHRILAAFLAVPREKFAPPGREALAYLDARIPLGPPGRAMLDPMTLAKLVQLAEPGESERVLVVGSGLGYSAAIFSELAGRVVGLESDPNLAAASRETLSDRSNVAIVTGPLASGAPHEAPFDLIFFDGAVTAGLETLAAQLAPTGRLVGPAGPGRATKATVFRPSETELTAAPAFDAYAPALPGFEPVEAFAF